MEANEFEPCLRKTVWGVGMVIHGTQWVHRTECSHSWVPPPFSPPYVRQVLGPAASTSLGNMVDILGSAPDFNRMLWGRRTDTLCCHMPFGC